MTALLLALLALPPTIAAAVPLEPVPVLATSYTCQDHPANNMFPCNTTRWGVDPAMDGMACPSDWARMGLFVPTQGLLTCDDSSRHDTLYGLPHVDLRVVTYDEAVTWGIKEIVVYRWIVPVRGQERKL
jgi:hypothetical protein